MRFKNKIFANLKLHCYVNTAAMIYYHMYLLELNQWEWLPGFLGNDPPVSTIRMTRLIHMYRIFTCFSHVNLKHIFDDVNIYLKCD